MRENKWMYYLHSSSSSREVGRGNFIDDMIRIIEKYWHKRIVVVHVPFDSFTKMWLALRRFYHDCYVRAPVAACGPTKPAFLLTSNLSPM